ncbi:21539_t:CDS:2, partial [Dentiscutata erythropus]
MRSSDTLFLLLIILFIEWIKCYSPAGRRELASVLVSNKLYFYGDGIGMLVSKAAYSAIVYENDIIIFGGGATLNSPGIINDLVTVVDSINAKMYIWSGEDNN